MSDNDGKIYADASQAATLHNGGSAIPCLTLQEAVLAWYRLPDDERKRATVVAADGQLYTAQEIVRLHYGRRVEGGALLNGSPLNRFALNQMSTDFDVDLGSVAEKTTTPVDLGSVTDHATVKVDLGSIQQRVTFTPNVNRAAAPVAPARTAGTAPAEITTTVAAYNGAPVAVSGSSEDGPPQKDFGAAGSARAGARAQATLSITFADIEAVIGWLKEQSNDVAVVFAARAALRVLPTITFLPWPRDNVAPEVVLRVFRAASAAWAVAAYPGHRSELNNAARAALSGLGEVRAPSPIRAAVYASATATGEPDAASRASTVIGYALDAAAAQGPEAVQSLLHALATDAGLLNQRFDPVAIAYSQLWPAQVPDWVRGSWEELAQTLLDADENWEVWIDWYEERLAGDTANQEMEIAHVTMDELIWRQEPRAVNAKIKELNDGDGFIQAADGDEAEFAPEPPSGPGPQYRPQNGKLSEAASLPASDEVAQQLNLHRLVRRDAATFGTAIKLAANRFPELARAAGEYSKLLSGEIANVDVVALWSVGGALASFAQAYREQNSARTLAEPLEPQLDALLQSVVRQHGAFILGFEEGRDLVHRADEFAVDALRLSEIATSGTILLNELTDNRDLVDDRTRELHEPIRDRIVEIGWGTSRLSYSAYLIVRNGVRAMIKYSVGEHPDAGTVLGLIAGASVLLGDPNAEFIRAAVPVLQQHGSQLVAFFNHSPEMRAYIEWAQRVLNADHAGR